MRVLAFYLLLFSQIFAAELEIVINNIKPEKGGNIIFAICEPDKKFPCNKDNAYKVGKIKVEQSSAKIVFDLPNGVYAVVDGHDENSNNIVDKNMFGIPTEGYAISGKETSIPKFETAKFDLNKNTQIIMKMKY
ncbi:MAG: hypothetical protein RL154_49 [Pseudomonadota bacterium]